MASIACYLYSIFRSSISISIPTNGFECPYLSGPKTFVRDATGLVRQLNFFDHVLTNMNGVIPMASMVLTPWWIWFAVPGGDPLVVMMGGYLCGVFGTLFVFCGDLSNFPSLSLTVRGY